MRFLKHYKVEICRCEQSDYGEFDGQHYLKGIGKGSSCFKLRIDGNEVAFIAIQSMPIRDYANCVIFHRIVIKDEYRGLGLSWLILNFIGGIYLQNGKQIYIKTSSKRMGKMLRNNPLWEATIMNQRTRHLTKADHKRNNSRQRRAAFSYRYKGNGIEGYDNLTEKVNVVRGDGLMNRYYPIETYDLLKSKYRINLPVFWSDSIRLEFIDLERLYKASYGSSHKEEGLYTQEVKVRYRDFKNASETYLLRLLYLNGIIYYTQHPCSKEELAYHLLEDNHKQNFGISHDKILKLALRIFYNKKEDFLPFIENLKSRHLYTVNKEEAQKRGLNPKQASNIARKEIRAKQIESLYEPSRTDEENLKHFSENGFSISLSTLKRWRKEHGISRYNKSVIPTT